MGPAQGSVGHSASSEHAVNGERHCAEWNCRAGQNDVIIRTAGTVTPFFPMYTSTYDWGNIDKHNFDDGSSPGMKKPSNSIVFPH